MIRGFRSVLFVSCFKIRCFVIVLLRAKIDELRLLRRFFWSFLILVTCKNKATSAFFLRQKIHSPSRFPSLFLSSLGSFSVTLGEHVTLWFVLTPPSLKWLMEQKNPRLQYAQRYTTNFAVRIICVIYNVFIKYSFTAIENLKFEIYFRFRRIQTYRIFYFLRRLLAKHQTLSS